MAFLFLIIFTHVIKSNDFTLNIQDLEINKNDISIVILALIVLIIIANYISIKNYKL